MCRVQHYIRFVLGRDKNSTHHLGVGVCEDYMKLGMYQAYDKRVKNCTYFY